MTTGWWRWPLVLWLHCTDLLYSSRIRIWWFSLKDRSFCIPSRCIEMKWRILWQRIHLPRLNSLLLHPLYHNGPDCPNRLPLLCCFCSHPSSYERNSRSISGHNLEKGNKYKNRINSLNLEGQHIQLPTVTIQIFLFRRVNHLVWNAYWTFAHHLICSDKPECLDQSIVIKVVHTMSFV